MGCDAPPGLKADPAAILAQSQGPVTGPDCASCHAYPLQDVQHQYHLVAANVNRNNLGHPELNGLTTCMDCHFNSVRSFGYIHSDTTWMDSNGVEVEGHSSPSDRVMKIENFPRWSPVPYAATKAADGEARAQEIDSLLFREARLGKLLAWMTARDHQDGRVQVTFSPNVLTRPDPGSTAYRPADQSCSSVACHATHEARYRWKDPARGLGNCPSLDGNDPSCDETSSPE
jgi:hypothetical protein